MALVMLVASRTDSSRYDPARTHDDRVHPPLMLEPLTGSSILPPDICGPLTAHPLPLTLFDIDPQLVRPS